MKPAILVCIVLSVACSAQTTIDRSNGFGGMSGNDLLPLCQALEDQADGKTLSDSRVFDAIRCGSYISGLLDGFTVRESGTDVKPVLCFPDGVTAAQMFRVVTK